MAAGGLLLQKIGMRAGAYKANLVTGVKVNQQPVRFDMAFPKIFLITFQSMVFVLGRQGLT